MPVPTARQDVPAGLPFQPAPLFRPDPRADDRDTADCRGRRIGVLIVTHNHVSTLVPVLQRITPNVWRNVEEVVIFDDASDDATFELAMGVKASRDLPKLTVLKHPRNVGYGGNQKEGYRYFLERGFDVVVLLHGDGQYAPELLAQMYEPIVNGRAHAVLGSRFLGKYGSPLRAGMPFYKYVGNRVLTFRQNRALGLTLSEFHSGYRAYDLHALAKLDLGAMSDDFHFDTELLIKLHHQAFRLVEVPIPTYYSSELGLGKGFKHARRVIQAVRRYKQTVRSARSAPEFREYFVHYPVKEARDSSHDFARRLVGTGHDVLDVACGEGFLAEQLKAMGNRVTGVDARPSPARPEAFEAYIEQKIGEDFQAVIDRLGERRFDRVLLLDVLEHLENPAQVLRDCARIVRPDGRVIVSLPNVANLTVRLGLLFGRFNYADRGVLDRTHRHFYTWTSARRLLEDAGWVVELQRATVMPVELVTGWSRANVLMRVTAPTLRATTRALPRLFGYQVVLVARRPAS